MPRLILLNGPPGCGKSTLAQMYVQSHPLALNLDIDRVRALIGQWRSSAREAGLLARELSLAMARVHLAAGHDVVIPQYLASAQFIEQVQTLAAEVGAHLDEIVLLDSREASLRRFEKRSAAAAEPAHTEAQAMVDAAGGPAGFADMYDRLLAVLGSRPGARVVRTHAGEVERAYRDFVKMLS